MTVSGKMIKEAREKARLTQEQLGEMLGVTGVTIMRYEKGQRQPRFEQIEAIAAALNVSFVDLFDPVIASALQTIVDNNIDSADECIREKYGIVGDYVVVETNNDDIRKLMQAYTKLNSSGQKEAIRNVEIIAGNPIFQRQEAPESTQGLEGTEIPQNAEKPPEGL